MPTALPYNAHQSFHHSVRKKDTGKRINLDEMVDDAEEQVGAEHTHALSRFC